MNELQNIHNEYLKEDHPEEDEDDTNLEPQKGTLGVRQGTVGRRRTQPTSSKKLSW